MAAEAAAPTGMITDPWFYAVAIPAVLIVGISKGGLAGGLGVVGVPLMALAVPPLQAAAVLLPVLMVMDLQGVWEYRRDWDRRNIILLIPGALLGIVLGALTARFVSDDLVRILVGLTAVVFTVLFWVKPAPPAGAARGPVSGTLWGFVAGYTSFLAHAGGPPIQVHLLPQRLDKRAYVATTTIFFVVVNLAKLPPYLLVGTLDRSALLTALVLLPLAPIGMRIGFWIVRSLPTEPFYKLCYVLVLITGIKLLWDGFGLG